MPIPLLHEPLSQRSVGTPPEQPSSGSASSHSGHWIAGRLGHRPHSHATFRQFLHSGDHFVDGCLETAADVEFAASGLGRCAGRCGGFSDVTDERELTGLASVAASHECPSERPGGFEDAVNRHVRPLPRAEYGEVAQGGDLESPLGIHIGELFTSSFGHTVGAHRCDCAVTSGHGGFAVDRGTRRQHHSPHAGFQSRIQDGLGAANVDLAGGSEARSPRILHAGPGRQVIDTAGSGEQHRQVRCADVGQQQSERSPAHGRIKVLRFLSRAVPVVKVVQPDDAMSPFDEDVNQMRAYKPGRPRNYRKIDR